MISRLMFILLGLALVGCKKNVPPVIEVPVATVVEPVAEPTQIPEDVMALVQNFSRIYFDVDSATLNSMAKSALNDNIEILSRRQDIKLEIQGHADERGTTDYNLALGQRRANNVYNHIKSSGISQSRLKVVSYGEEQPLRSGGSESSWSQNRRCEFVITWSDPNASGSVSGSASD